MDCAPLNLAHFHERRANRFLQRHRYDEAYKAVETSLLYLQDAIKTVCLPKSIEVLNTQKWEYERKLRQIQMHKQQHERLKHKEIVPLYPANTSLPLLRIESNVTAQSVAKSIDKTIRDFDEKLGLIPKRRILVSKENQEPNGSSDSIKNMFASEPMTQTYESKVSVDNRPAFYLGESYEIPPLAPLELPTFDALATLAITALSESFNKE